MKADEYSCKCGKYQGFRYREVICDKCGEPVYPNYKSAEITMKRVALADVLPHERNPRIHPAPGTPAWETLKVSLVHDYFDPLVLNEMNNKWVSGHLRAKVLLAEGYTHADVVVKDYDEPTHYARMIAANKQIGDFDMPLLKDLLLDLDSLNMPMDLTGFGLPEIEDLMTQFHVPEENKSIDEDAMTKTENECPKCGFTW